MNRESKTTASSASSHSIGSKLPKDYASPTALVAALDEKLRLPISEEQYDMVLTIAQSPYKDTRTGLGDALDKASSILYAWPLCSRLAVDLALSKRLSENTGFVVSLVDRLRAKYEAEIGFPPKFHGDSQETLKPEERAVQLHNWVSALVQGTRSLRKQTPTAAEVSLTDEQYKALMCLVLETTIPWEAIYRFLSSVCPPDKVSRDSDTRRLEGFAFFRRLQMAMSVKGAPKRLLQGVDWSGPLLTLLTARSAERDAARKEALDMSTSQSRMRERLYEVNQQNREHEAKVAALEEELARQRAELAKAEERLREREQHWKITASNEQARFVADVHHQLAHEVEEAYLALDAGNPSIDMALKRLKQAKIIISNLE